MKNKTRNLLFLQNLKFQIFLTLEKVHPFGYWFANLIEQRGFQNQEMICFDPLDERDQIKKVDFKDDFMWATATAGKYLKISKKNFDKFLS